MLKLLVLKKNLDGIGVAAGTPFNLILFPVGSSSNQIDLGEHASLAAAKTFAVSIFKATLAWTDGTGGGSESAVFTA